MQNVTSSLRFDVPTNWPTLVPCLLQGIQSSSPSQRYCALLMLYHTVKALSTKRLAADRRAFHEMMLELIPYLINIYRTNHQELVLLVSHFF